MFTLLSPEIESVGKSVVDSAYTVHNALGPGLLESVYEACMIHELEERGLKVRNQVPFPVHYKQVKLPAGFRLDLIVEDCVVLEVKSVEALHPVHRAQVVTYLKLTELELGYLMNFNVRLIRDGIKRIRPNSD